MGEDVPIKDNHCSNCQLTEVYRIIFRPGALCRCKPGMGLFSALAVDDITADDNPMHFMAADECPHFVSMGKLGLTLAEELGI